ncbi:MAG: SpoIIE family protein phosphatase [Salinivirgaceae bacterium]|nr:SpoIIE family protein phosphatase [Salinivirgaceae bacterium]
MAFTNISKGFDPNKIIEYNLIDVQEFPFNIPVFELINISTKQIISIEAQIEDSKTEKNSTKLLQLNYIAGEYHLLKGEYAEASVFYFACLSFAVSASEKAFLYEKLAVCEIGKTNFINALEYLRLAKEDITENHKQLETSIYILEAFCYTNLGGFDAADKRITIVESLMVDNESSLLAASFFSIKAMNYKFQYDFSNATAYYLKSNKLLLNDSINFTSIINLKCLADIYYYQHKYDKGIVYLEKAIRIASYFGNESAKSALILRLSDYYLAKNDINTSIEFIRKAKDLCNDKTLQTYGLARLKLLNAYLVQKNTDSSNYYFKEVQGLGFIGEADIEIQKQMVLAKYFNFNSDFNKSISFASEALQYANKTKNLFFISEIKDLLAESYCLARRFKKAYAFSQQAKQLNDSLNRSLFSFDIQVNETKLEWQYQQSLINKLTNENSLQNKDLVDSKKAIEKQKGYIFIGLFVMIFAFTVLVLLSLWIRSNKKANKRLSIINKKIAQQNEEIEVQSQHLMEANEELNKLSIIASETDNGIKVMNASGRITWINEGYTKLHGYKLDELQSIDSYSLIGDHANINISELVSVWYGDKKPISFQSLNKTKSGTAIWTQTTITPVLGENGRINQMIAIDSDITKLKEAEREITLKNIDITASISYAKRIQEAMLTPFKVITREFQNSVCFYKPKSIVSGDFYWMSKKNNKLVVACADSTGHGVPGAFMSLIGISFLNKIVNEKGFISPAIILNRLRTNIINHLNQKDSESSAGDGMDMAIVTIDLKTHSMEYAGAMNPVIIFRNGELIELKPDRMPVGFFDNEDAPFSSTSIDLNKNDQIYLYTDGLYDQFGGEEGAKLKSVKFKEILKMASNKSVEDQLQIIESAYDTWKGNYTQVDDILIMGIQID